MLDFLKGIADFITMIVNLVITVITSILEFIGMIPAWITWLLTAFSYTPSMMFSFLISGVLLSVIMFVIVGRSGNGG